MLEQRRNTIEEYTKARYVAGVAREFELRRERCAVLRDGKRRLETAYLGGGTPSQLEGYRPGTRHLVIVVKATDDFTAFDPEEHGHLGDFIILTDASLPRSYEAQ